MPDPQGGGRVWTAARPSDPRPHAAGFRHIPITQTNRRKHNTMNNLAKNAALVLATLALTACAGDEKMTRAEPTALREASSNAESACMAAVNRNFGGKVANIEVTSSESSQANEVVMMKAGGQHWKCLASRAGKVQDLSVVGN